MILRASIKSTPGIPVLILTAINSKFGRGQMEKPFEDAASAMRGPGELAGLAETRYGFHIIKLVDYFPEVTPAVEEVGG
jgi:hypothetical protein